MKPRTRVASDEEPLALMIRMMPSTTRTWITTETVPVITAPSPSPRVVRLLFSASSSGSGGRMMTMGTGMPGT